MTADGMASRRAFLAGVAVEEAKEKVAIAADAFLWNRTEETDRALVEAVADWRSKLGRWRLACDLRDRERS